MLSDLFRKLRRKEPTRILIFRRLVIIASLALLIVIFGILCIGVRDELPSIKTTSRRVHSLPAPDVAFYFNKNFTISCEIREVHDNVNTTRGRAECDEHIAQTEYHNTLTLGNHNYVGGFLPAGNLNFSNPGVFLVLVVLNITDPTYDPSNVTQTILMRAYDSEYSMFRRAFDPNNIRDSFEDEILFKNEYQLSQTNNSFSGYFWYFSRHIRYKMVQDALSYIGFQPNYIERPYIDSTIQFFPTTSTSNNLIQVQIIQQSFTITEETEQRNKTIISALGVIAGFWGVIVSFYGLLFGNDLISPFGLAQKLLKPKSSLVEDSQSDINIKSCEEPLEKFYDLEKRIKYLENLNQFYKEYVVNVSLSDPVKE